MCGYLDHPNRSARIPTHAHNSQPQRAEIPTQIISSPGYLKFSLVRNAPHVWVDIVIQNLLPVLCLMLVPIIQINTFKRTRTFGNPLVKINQSAGLLSFCLPIFEFTRLPVRMPTFLPVMFT
jgi:hypothetical protein